jgi:ketosteroid isomerase-like protein
VPQGQVLGDRLGRRPGDTTSVGQNAALLRKAFEAFNRAGIDSVLDLMHPEVEVVDLPHVPEERHHQGRAAIAVWFHSLDEIWDRLRVDAEEVTELDGERVLAVIRFSGCARSSGVEVDQVVATVFTFDEGKAVRWRIYPTRDEAVADAATQSAGGA